MHANKPEMAKKWEKKESVDNDTSQKEAIDVSEKYLKQLVYEELIKALREIS